MRRWEEIFPEIDRLVCKKQGWGERQSPGHKPALLIIDATRGSVGSKPMPIIEATNQYPGCCGESGWRALGNIEKLLSACRTNTIPIIFTQGDPAAWRFAGMGGTKNKKVRSSYMNQQILLEGNEIVDAIAPLSSELIIKKTKPSAFQGTSLHSYLHSMGIDCLLVAGCTTSGCVRATVVEALTYGFPCFVVEECVYDRWDLSHLVSLFDMNAKYATVITVEEALSYVNKMTKIA